MRYRKEYGKSRLDTCYFCEKAATTENRQGVPACAAHKGSMVDDKRCVCGEWMQVKKGKFGSFFLCPNCGPVSMKRAENMEGSGFRLNKRYRSERGSGKDSKTVPAKERAYTLDELERIL